MVFSRVIAEAGSQVGALGAILVAKKVFPDQMNGLKHMLAEAVIKPRIDAFDAFLDRFPSIEPGGQDGKRKKLDPKQRAEYIADLLVDFGVLASSGIAAQMAVQSASNAMLGMPKVKMTKMAGAVLVDKAAQIGAFSLSNTLFSEQNAAIQKTISSALQAEGRDKDTADAAGSFATNWIAPNIVGMIGGLAMQNRIYKKEIAQALHGGSGAAVAHA